MAYPASDKLEIGEYMVMIYEMSTVTNIFILTVQLIILESILRNWSDMALFVYAYAHLP